MQTVDSEGWFALAIQPGIVRRALGYTVVVGAILITINHGDAILHGDMPIGRIARMILTAAVPYVVSTLSSIGAMRSAQTSRNSARSSGLPASKE